MINYIFGIFILLGVGYSLLTNNANIINTQILESSKSTLDLVLKLFPLIAMWNGIMNIALKSGLIKKLSNFLKPLFSRIFPDIPKNHESLEYISSNVIANFFGLGSAATPFGLKAMKSLQELNKDKNVASSSMITFLVLNTSGFTLIPTTIVSLRVIYGSSNPTSIILVCIIATFFATIGGLIFDKVVRKLTN